jgi:hypothetical protein
MDRLASNRMRLMISGWELACRESQPSSVVVTVWLYELMGNVQYLAYAITPNMLSYHYVQVIL